MHVEMPVLTQADPCEFRAGVRILCYLTQMVVDSHRRAFISLNMHDMRECGRKGKYIFGRGKYIVIVCLRLHLHRHLYKIIPSIIKL